MSLDCLSMYKTTTEGETFERKPGQKYGWEGEKNMRHLIDGDIHQGK